MGASVSRHRRSRRLVAVAVGGVCLALLAGGGTVKYLASDDRCRGGTVTVTVAASLDQFSVLSKLADDFDAGHPKVGGRCAAVNVRPVQSSVMAQVLDDSWDTDRDGPRPDVWVPESSAWLLLAAKRPAAARLLPAGAPPSVATSPVVLGMQRDMAQAMGWPDRDLGWTDLIGAFSRGEDWSAFSHPEWGRLRLGVPDPATSTAGLVAVMTILDPDNDGTMSDEEVFGGLASAQLVTATGADTDEMLRPYAAGGASDRSASTLPAALPLTERDLANYTAVGAGVDLVPVYPREGVVFADYPYTVLRASWVDDDRRAVAEAFLSDLDTERARKAYGAEGFRDPSRATQDTSVLIPDKGFRMEVRLPQRVPTGDGLTQLLDMWASLQRPANALLTLDTSGSMNEKVPGTDLTRLQLVQQAATRGAALLSDQTTIGLWQFSSHLSGADDYRELVAPGPASDRVGDMTRRQKMASEVARLRADGGSGLYDAIYAGYLRMQQAWQSGGSNVLVVMTDGRNEDDAGLSRAQLLDRLHGAVRTDRPVTVVGIAVGPEADVDSLQAVVKVTGGRTVVARNELDAVQQIVLAFAGRIG